MGIISEITMNPQELEELEKKYGDFVEDYQRYLERVEDMQDTYNRRVEDAERDHQDRLLEIAETGIEQREEERKTYEGTAVFIWEVEQAGVGKARFLDRCRNISPHGAAFLHGAYVHPQTPCDLILLPDRKRGVRIRARVVRCEHYNARIHDVGVQFAEALDLSTLFGPEESSED